MISEPSLPKHKKVSGTQFMRAQKVFILLQKNKRHKAIFIYLMPFLVCTLFFFQKYFTACTLPDSMLTMSDRMLLAIRLAPRRNIRLLSHSSPRVASTMAI